MERIRRLVRVSYAIRNGIPSAAVDEMNAHQKMPADMAQEILGDMSGYLKRRIPPRTEPRHGWSFSTIEGYVYHEQDSFPPLSE